MNDHPFARRRGPGTRWTVRAADKLARLFITIGGIGTIVAVSGVCVFLVAVVIPIFRPGARHEVGQARLEGARPLYLAVDEYRVMGWALERDGMLRVFRLDSGDTLATRRLVDGASLTAWAFRDGGASAAFGFADGSVRLATLAFTTDYPPASSLPASAATLAEGQTLVAGDAIVQRTPEGQLRRQRLHAEVGDRVPASGGASVALIDHIEGARGSVIGRLDADGMLHFDRVEQYENLLTGEVTTDVSGGTVEVPTARGPRGLPAHLVLAQSGASAFLVWKDGHVVRCDARDISAPHLAGSAELLEDGRRLTAFGTLLGGATLLGGDERGDVTASFSYRGRDSDEEDCALARARTFRRKDAAVTALGASQRTRVFAAGYADGGVRLYQATSGARILDFHAGDAPVAALCMSPKNDGLVVLSGGELHHYDIRLGHPEATLASLFRPVWYEGYPRPEHVWQSSSATDDFEPKFGMWPLVFGTLKATLYSMLFGIPIALLAAIYTSEFMSPALRSRVKTLIEAMASLPSVVLGFLAALVFAPFVQRVVPATIVTFLAVPMAFLAGAYVWQLLPQSLTIRHQRLRLVILLALLPAAVFAALELGPAVERVLFAGDVMAWLDGQRGSAFGGWLVPFIPPAVLAAIWLSDRAIGARFRATAARASRQRVAALDLVRFFSIALAALALAAATAALLTALGADPRGKGALLDTYVQRNALVVGFVMGFAIIPIIYTIAEDALSAVPDHLRAASLGAGATPWQTAVRIVLPTAMSGLFSAVMIGLGRAVGETMIVLMAAGNTPILEMNIFNGFRTLSANIAVELPEAVRDSTHYRTLFLAALLLFAMTFAINTVAESVRLRFRRRSAQI